MLLFFQSAPEEGQEEGQEDCAENRMRDSGLGNQHLTASWILLPPVFSPINTECRLLPHARPWAAAIPVSPVRWAELRRVQTWGGLLNVKSSGASTLDCLGNWPLA